jgi:polysaccharide biosynthesis/export protein
MKMKAHHPVLCGLILIAVCGTMPAQSGSGSVPPPAAGAGAATADTVTPPGGKPHDSSFIIGNDDMLSINVWKEPDFTQTIPVRSDGKISLPLIGELQASGRTPLQLEQDITAKLRTYITDPDVTVMVTKINSQRINILGRVVKPGSYTLSAAPTVLDAIAAAGGFQDFAKQKGVYVLRQAAGGRETRIAFNYKDFIKGKNPGENIKLQAHDTVVVP